MRLKTTCTHTVSDRWSSVRQRETAVRFHAKENNNTTEMMDRHSGRAASGAEPQTHQSWYQYNSSCRTGRRRTRAPLTDPPQRTTWWKCSRLSASPRGNCAPHWPDSPSEVEVEAERRVGYNVTLQQQWEWNGMVYLESKKKLDGVGERRWGRKVKPMDQSEEKKVDKRPGETQRRGEPGRQTQGTGLWEVEQICFIIINSYKLSSNLFLLNFLKINSDFKIASNKRCHLNPISW